MKMNRRMLAGGIGLLSFLCVPGVFAQDALPRKTEKDAGITHPIAMKDIVKTDSVYYTIVLPKPFTETKDNYIIDDGMVLKPVWERLRRMKASSSEDTLRIVHIGDSHVRGHIFPQTTGEMLRAEFGAITYTDLGVNGATCLTFTHPDRIAAVTELSPDLLILSFGTNESHNRRYNENIHYSQMDELVKLLQARLPHTPMLLTTPPGSYDSHRRSRRARRTYTINPRTANAAENICRYAKNHGLAAWDMYTVAGGRSRACKNWTESGLMRPDHVHYLPEGYVLQGQLLYDAIINSYNAYVSY